MYGSDKCLYELLIGLPEDFQSLVILPEEGPLADKLRSENIPVIIIRLGVIRRRCVHPFRIFKLIYRLIYSFFKLIQIIKKENINLVHTNVSVIFVGALAAFITGRKHFWHIREILPDKFLVTKLYLKFIKLFSSEILCMSQTVKDQFGSHNKAQLLFDGINLNTKQNISDRSKIYQEFELKDKKIVGMIGRINHWKGQQYFIEAASRLKNDPNIVFFVIGDVYKGNEHLKQELINYSKKLKMEDRIIFTGFRNDIDGFLLNFDVFVLPSTSPEPFGIVLLEAMVNGVPVVATNHGGPRDVVANGETGILVSPTDSKELSEAISKLLGNAELRRTMGENGRRRVKMFSMEKQILKMTELYQRALG